MNATGIPKKAKSSGASKSDTTNSAQYVQSLNIARLGWHSFINTGTFVARNLASGKARGGSIPQSGAVTDEQRSHRPNSAQPFGRQFFFGQTSLRATYRAIAGYAR